MEEDKNKKVEEGTTDSPAPGDESKTDPNLNKDENPSEDKIDYKAELEKAKKELNQAQHTIIKLKEKKKDEEDEEDEKDDFDLKLNELKEAQKQEFEKLKTDLVKDTIDDVLSTLTENSDEKELIRFNYENRIVRSGTDRKSIQEDLVSAQLLANKSKLSKQINELKYTLNSEMGKNKNGSATGENKEQKSIKLTDQEEAWVKQTALRMKLPEEAVRKKLIANKNY